MSPCFASGVSHKSSYLLRWHASVFIGNWQGLPVKAHIPVLGILLGSKLIAFPYCIESGVTL